MRHLPCGRPVGENTFTGNQGDRTLTQASVGDIGAEKGMGLNAAAISYSSHDNFPIRDHLSAEAL